MNTRTVYILAGVFVGLALLAHQAASEVIEDVKEINKGTPYAGYGVVGTLGNITNKLSGGYLAKFGSWLGAKVLP